MFRPFEWPVEEIDDLASRRLVRPVVDFLTIDDWENDFYKPRIPLLHLVRRLVRKQETVAEEDGTLKNMFGVFRNRPRFACIQPILEVGADDRYLLPVEHSLSAPFTFVQRDE